MSTTRLTLDPKLHVSIEIESVVHNSELRHHPLHACGGQLTVEPTKRTEQSCAAFSNVDVDGYKHINLLRQGMPPE